MAVAVKKSGNDAAAVPRARISVQGGQAFSPSDCTLASPVSQPQAGSGGYIIQTMATSIKEGSLANGCQLGRINLPFFFGGKGSSQNLRGRTDPYIVLQGVEIASGTINPLIN